MATFTAWDDNALWDDAAIWFEGLMVDPLLPPNSTAQEFALEQATARMADVRVPIRSTWDPDTCPAGLLPWLAWALGVDEWDAGWSDEAKREAIRRSVSIHRRKGTVGAIRAALKNAGYGDATLIERWANQSYDGSIIHNGAHNHASSDHWAEYRVVMARPITNAQAQKVRGILAAIAPLRCHLKHLDFQAVSYTYNAAIRYDGAANHGAA